MHYKSNGDESYESSVSKLNDLFASFVWSAGECCSLEVHFGSVKPGHGAIDVPLLVENNLYYYY